MVATALTAALLGGIFYAFSSFVMPALGRIPPDEGIRAMQRINVDVLTPSFYAVFFGAPILALGLGVRAVLDWHDPSAVYCAVGAAILVGGFLVTLLGNVPLNNALAGVDAAHVDASEAWRGFAAPWVRWNHVRAAVSLAGAAAFLAAALVHG